MYQLIQPRLRFMGNGEKQHLKLYFPFIPGDITNRVIGFFWKWIPNQKVFLRRGFRYIR